MASPGQTTIMFGSTRINALRAEFDAVRKVGEGYEARLQALLKAEEEGLAAMKKELEAREAWLESLKKAVSGEK